MAGFPTSYVTVNVTETPVPGTDQEEIGVIAIDPFDGSVITTESGLVLAIG